MERIMVGDFPVTIDLENIAFQIHENAISKGFWKDNPSVAKKLALVHSEISEALEADREGDMENLGEELADAIIRILDLATRLEINIEHHILAKHLVNIDRPYKHGKAY